MFVVLALGAVAFACNDSEGPASTGADESDSDTPADTGAETETGDGDGDPGDGDGDPGDGDGDPGDGDGDPGDGDGDEPGPECPVNPEPSLGDWLFMLADDKVFPNDVPVDVDESCTVLDGADDRLTLDCPFAAFELILLLEPLPALPESGATAQVRVHHEPGWKNWPDLWIRVDVEGGDLYSFTASSALEPKLGEYEVPWSPSLNDVACEPFGGGVGDTCGEQVARLVEFDVDGEQVPAWHASYSSTEVGGKAFEAWVSVAREYVAPSETCDISPSWFSVVGRRER